MLDTTTETEAKEPGVRKGWWSWFMLIAASAFVLYHVLYISDFLVLYTPLTISPSLHLGVHLASILFFTFLLVRARRGTKTDKPPVYDVVLAFVALVIPLYYGLFFEEIYTRTGEGVLLYGMFGWILAALLLEASRRLLGVPFTLVIAFFLLYPVFAKYFPGVFHHRGVPFLRAGEFFFASYNGIMSFILGISATIVVVFVLFSQFLIHSGVGKFFIDLAYSAFGMMRGGPAKMSVIGSAFFGMLSGSAAGNVAATGTFTIPMMTKIGYPSHYAGAVVGVAGLGGMLMPPVMGAVIFILVDFIQVPYIEVAARAAIPAVLYYLALFVMVDQEAARLGLRGLAKGMLPPLGKTLKQGWWYGIPLFLLVYLMAGVGYTPQKAAIWSAVVLLALSMFRKETRLGPMKLAVASEQTLRAMLMIGVAMACAGIITGAVSITGVGVNISRTLVTVSGGNLVILLLLTAITSFIMGLGVGIAGCYVFLAVLVAPALVEVGVPLIAAHLFIFYWALVSDITPPVCTTIFVAAGIAGSDPMKTGWQATRLGILLYVVPFAFVIKPALLALGTPMEIIVAVASAVIGTVGLSFGVGGHFLGNLNWLQRSLCLVGSLLVIFSSSAVLMGSGAIILGVVLFWQWLRFQSRRDKLSSYHEVEK